MSPTTVLVLLVYTYVANILRAGSVFRKAIQTSICYARTPISMINEHDLRISCYVPTIVAECGGFLKEKGTWHDDNVNEG
jgi:hypothetical protein